MNWKQNYSYLLFAAAILIGCDSFQEDLAPIGEQELELTDAISVLPNTPLLIDLKKTLQTASTVKFDIVSAPKFGDVSILEQTILEYRPHQSYVSGTDIISLSISDELGNLIDTDSIVISMESSTDSLPCFNGALSDYYAIIVSDAQLGNESVLIAPIINDGYCIDNTSGAILDFIDEPEHGQLEQVELFTYLYIADPGYLGLDVFKYELTLVDNDGEEFYSLAEVQIEIMEDNTSSGSCDSLVYPFVVHLSDSLDTIEILPFMPGAACDVIDWDLTINAVSFGSAQVSSGNLIEYTRGAGNDSIAFIDYSISLLDLTVENEITVFLETKADDDPNDCLIANDDNYSIYIVEDSVGTENTPYYLDITYNDILCESSFDLSLITLPNLGEAEITENKILEYFVTQEFSGILETSFQYQICNDDECDSAYVFLTVERQ